MSGVVESDLHFRIGHVLFIDIVGYSNLRITERHVMSRTKPVGAHDNGIPTAEATANGFVRRAMEWRWLILSTDEAGYKMACKTQR